MANKENETNEAATEKHAGGRPPKWAALKDFENDSEGFFDWCKDAENEYIPDVEGLAVYCECSRDTINEYEKKPEFSATIKAIKDKIAFHKKQIALKGDMPAAIFCFDFKNNHGYMDKTEIDHTTKGQAIQPSITFSE